ncbi:MAG: ATP synthase subunit delta [Candidatus Wolfebacteria bacterium GW2011_GWC2_46_275]|uniref:ATP synthase subunit delta n=2 Tax=Candidatus Wolfeibacteriota TaxID=1752735 RepID=A0A0G1U852_9BACT|nr:MAG: ATP synthase F1 subunit delta, F-type H+-transporting ATPase subunit delta [Candidatus Wolfebacteria bacterium GW2011_GWB1_47_1]KKU37215.1 MAG: ATP synthase subunit delta [Candidatus Wolfebacteria bacterium GW2011_GWC2_46_275]KKU42625.1 MAG: ATP synthase subunit delta [Candidatus Wolfebacteria bacterium GW2011_GWB2_46_69]KKU54640.1 MAG: ATP synthase subunit delta [Candidatus Wolfebacteria bacterium GW2011_GWC1_47_103]KKU59189.1 MAG: ATP synthase subunit delta [Candidatus Wolfebacteria b
MKTTSIQYARALFESTTGKEPHETDAIIGRFADQLRRDGQVSRLASIIASFEMLWNKEYGIVEAIVTSRDRLDDATRANIMQFVMHRYRAKQVEIVERVDASIRGGVVIRVGDEILDGSISSQLKKLKKNLAGTGVTQS